MDRGDKAARKGGVPDSNFSMMSFQNDPALIQKNHIQEIAWMINRKSGILIKDSEIPVLKNKVIMRLKTLVLNADKYLELLNSNELDGKKEWDVLMQMVTIGETYFFRDREHLNIIKYIIASELSKTEDKVKILSAGCATGEEAYTIAILLKESNDICHSRIQICGVDLNKISITKAKEGIYTAWSFRGYAHNCKRFFNKIDNNHWQIKKEIKSMVSFHHLNLITDELLQLGYFDIVVCRNVFIYFDKLSIKTVLDKFSECLKPGGFLIAGHTELCEQSIDRFELFNHNHGIVYRLQTISQHMQLKDRKLIVPFTNNTEIALAKRYYDRGELDKAQRTLMKFLLVDPTNYKANFLRFLIAQKQGESQKAKERLRELIFLYPESPDAYIELIKCSLQDGEYEISRQLLAVVSNLKTLSPHHKSEIKALLGKR